MKIGQKVFGTAPSRQLVTTKNFSLVSLFSQYTIFLTNTRPATLTELSSRLMFSRVQKRRDIKQENKGPRTTLLGVDPAAARPQKQ